MLKQINIFIKQDNILINSSAYCRISTKYSRRKVQTISIYYVGFVISFKRADVKITNSDIEIILVDVICELQI